MNALNFVWFFCVKQGENFFCHRIRVERLRQNVIHINGLFRLKFDPPFFFESPAICDE